MNSLRLFFLLILITVFFTNIASAQGVKTMQIVRQPVVREFNPAFKGKPEQDIELLEHQLADALRLKDAAKLDLILADGVTIAGLIGDKKQFIALWSAVKTKYVTIEKSEMKIQMFGDTAVVSGTHKADIDVEGGSSFSQTSFMNTWKRIDGVWRCIAFMN